MYADYLEDYSIHQCYNAKDTLDCVDDVKPNLIIVDLGLPDMNGIEFINKLNESYNEPVKIIIISGILDIEACAKATEQGVVDLITKPFEREQLLDLVKRKLNIE